METVKSEAWASSSGSCKFHGGTDGIRTAGLRHVIENRDADGGLGLLTGKQPCSTLRAKIRLYRPIVVSTSERRP
jgi:hypothetical protein